MDAFTESPAVCITPSFVFIEAKNLIPLMAAYAEARKAMNKLVTNKKATVTKKDGGAGYTYAWTSLDVVLDTIHEAAIDAGLVYMLNVGTRANEHGKPEIYAERHIFHIATGVVLTFSSFVMPVIAIDSQSLGSAITYTRRYCALADWGVDDGTDDGGMKASGKDGQVETTASKQYQPAAQQNQQYQRQPAAQQNQQRQAASAPNHRNVPPATPAPTPAVAATEASGDERMHAAPPSADDGLSTDENGHTIITAGGESIDINEIDLAGEALCKQNWPKVFADGVATWENKMYQENGRVRLGDLEKFGTTDLFEFYSVTKRGLAQMMQAREKKQAERAQQTAPAVA